MEGEGNGGRGGDVVMGGDGKTEGGTDKEDERLDELLDEDFGDGEDENMVRQ